MHLLADPQVWLSFLTLTVLEIVLGIDNVIFLSMLVDRLPDTQRGSARILGLSFAMLTRIALLFSITWLATLRTPLFSLLGNELTGRELILFSGGLFLVVKSVGDIDIVFSLDSVFTAVGLAQHIEVMVAAIMLSVLVMMLVASAVGTFIERYPTIKVLSLAFLVLVGLSLMAESLDLEIPKGYLYFALAFSAAIEWIRQRLRGRGKT
jgi:predicted tellurium resistance membrane protein TerC